MATRTWTGNAQPIAQVTQWLFGGTWEVDDVIKVEINDQTETITSGSTTITTIIDTVVTALNASTIDEISGITWSRSGNYLVGTSDTPGVPFTCTVSTFESGGVIAPDAQTIDGAASSTGTDTTSATGPNHADNADNWSGNTLPVDGDTVVFTESTVDVLYGLDQSAVTPSEIRVTASYTGKIGLPRYDSDGNLEYRERFLKYGNSADATTTTINIGNGDGPGSSRINLDSGSGQVVLNVYQTGTSTSQTEPNPFTWKGTHASNTVTVHRGRVAIAPNPEDSATVATLSVAYTNNRGGDSVVVAGPNATISEVKSLGGKTTLDAAPTTLTATGGTVTVTTGNITTLSIDSATVNYDAAGTITTTTITSGGTLDCSRTANAKTLTNATVYKGGTIRDPDGTVTFTNGIDLPETRLLDVTLDLAKNKTWTPSTI